ncbi:MAG: heat-inducible transcriptional repressor HrcA [Proteobacteria bacterium]|nr:heat-inducible transcriptional repressor HrcA [Pseudomonadota bacterium]
MIPELSERSREIFRQIVEAYVETGEPVGSQLLSQRMSMKLSSASIRSVMADLQDAGLLYSPHTSAGRLPTASGLRFFVDGILEVGNVTEEERERIEAHCAASGRSVEEVLTEAIEGLSGLSRCAGLVVAPKEDARLHHIEFVALSSDRVLVIIVTEDGRVENRVMESEPGWTPMALAEATNFLNARIRGRTLHEVRAEILVEHERQRAELDELTRRVIDAGMATWGGDDERATLIVRGRANLLEDVNAAEDLERIRDLFNTLETRQGFMQLLDLTKDAEGVRIYIGAEDNIFNLAGCSVIVSPYVDSKARVVGAIGVIGPTRLNYARIIPMVDYTAKALGRAVG